ncbi:MAG TPA: T9SS type A sorting domain-containing protein, partial [Dongiaceae bacterium]|nr:T9SS type A sorting domain-containing protein [Dongiaceae bacterium]
ATTNTPGPLQAQGMVRVPTLDRTLLIGGDTGSGLTGAAWAWGCAFPATASVPGTPLVGTAALSLRIYPNPARSTTTIEYTLASANRVSIAVYDVSGRLIWRQPDTFEMGGRHAVAWGGTDLDGRPATAGVYFARVRSGPTSESRTLLLVH